MPPEVATTAVVIADELARGLFVSVLAMLVVFAVLAVIAVLMSLLGRLVTLVERKRAVPTDSAQLRPEPVVCQLVDDATMAAVTAAVAMVLRGKRFRIASLAGYDIQTARWTQAGRQRLLKKG